MKKTRIAFSVIISILILLCGINTITFAENNGSVSIVFSADRKTVKEGDSVTLTVTAYNNGDKTFFSKLMQTDFKFDNSVLEVETVSKTDNSTVTSTMEDGSVIRFAMIDTTTVNSGTEIKKEGTELFKLKFIAKEGSTGYSGSLFNINSAWIGDENWLPLETNLGAVPQVSICEIFYAESAEADATTPLSFEFGNSRQSIKSFIENNVSAIVFSGDKKESESGYKISNVSSDDFKEKAAGEYVFKGVVSAKEFEEGKTAYSDKDIEVLIPVTVKKYDLETGGYKIKLNTPYIEFERQDAGTLSAQDIKDAINQMNIKAIAEITNAESPAFGYSEEITLSATEAEGDLDLTVISNISENTNAVKVNTEAIFGDETNFENNISNMSLYAVVVPKATEGCISVSSTLLNYAPSVSVETDSSKIVLGSVFKARIYNSDGTYEESTYTVTESDVIAAKEQSKYTVTLPPFEKSLREMGYALGDTVCVYAYIDNSPIDDGGERGKNFITTAIKGDINNDNSVDDIDWTIIFNHVSYIIEYKGLPAWVDEAYNKSIFDAADVNCDGSVDDIDWTIIFNHVSYIIEDPNLPPWE